MNQVIKIISLVLLFLNFGYSAKTQEIEVIPQTGHYNAIKHLDFSPNGKLLLSTDEQQKLLVWELRSGGIIMNTRGKEGKFSIDGNHIYIQGKTYSLDDSKNQKPIRFPNKPTLQINAQEKMRWGNKDFKSQLRFYSNGALVKRITPDYQDFLFTDVAFNQDYAFASCEDGNIYVIQLNSKKVIKKLKHQNIKLNALAISKDGQYLAVGDGSGGITIWDLQTFKIDRVLRGKDLNLSRAHLWGAKNELYWSTQQGTLSKLALDHTELEVISKNTTKSNLPIQTFAIDSDANQLITLEGERYITRLDQDFNFLKRKSLKKQSNWLLAPFYLINPKFYLHTFGYDVSRGFGAHLELYTSKELQVKMFKNQNRFWPKRKRFFNANLNKIKRKNFNPRELQHLSYSLGYNSNILLAYDDKQRIFPISKKDSPNNLKTFQENLDHFASELETTLENASINNKSFQKKSLSPPITNPNVYKSITLLDSSYYAQVINSAIHVFKPSEALSYKVIPIGQDDIIILNEKNYYYSTKGGLEGVGFRYGTKFFHPKQFDLIYNRPDLILQSMGNFDSKTIEAFHKAYLKRLQQTGFTEEMLSTQLHAPEIEILNRNIPVLTNQAELQFKIKATDSLKLLDRLKVYVNEIPLYGQNGLNLRHLQTKQITQDIQLILSEGINKIQVSIQNQAAAESYQESFEIKYVPQSKNKQKPNLYLISMGVSQYNDQDMNLKYAAKDAIDISNLFLQRKNKYQNIIHHQFLDQDVNPQKIQLLKKELLQSQVEDHVILFYAGHGVLDEDYNYYLGTPKMDFNAPSIHGLAYELLENLLDSIPARKKLILIDACHAGEADIEQLKDIPITIGKVKFEGVRGAGKFQKPLNTRSSFELMKEIFIDLRQGTGATVVGSSGGSEAAYEQGDYKQGIFTYCLRQGLTKKKADLNHDGEVLISELHEYLRTTVSNLTNNHQRPTTRKGNIVYDFRIW